MRTHKLLAVIVASLLLGGVTPAIADEASDRAATVAILQQKYVKVLDQQRLTLLSIQAKAKPDAKLYKSAGDVIKDFDTNYSAIVKGLADPNQPLQPIIDLCDEEVGEFASSIDTLNILLKQATKTITCVKGKTTKKITAVAAVCPKGYTKKK